MTKQSDLFGFDSEAAAAQKHNEVMVAAHKVEWSINHTKMFPKFEDYMVHHNKLKGLGLDFEEAVRDYTADSSPYNDHLVDGHELSPMRVKNIAALKAGLNHPSMALTTPLVSHTGINVSGDRNQVRENPLVKLRVGQKITTPRFISSSVHPGVAHRMADAYISNMGPFGLIGPKREVIHRVDFHTPVGYTGLAYVGSMSSVAKEQEVTHSAGSSWIFKGKSIEPHRDNDVIVHHMEPVEK